MPVPGLEVEGQVAPLVVGQVVVQEPELQEAVLVGCQGQVLEVEGQRLHHPHQEVPTAYQTHSQTRHACMRGIGSWRAHRGWWE